jgi:hypothetical protein
LSVEELLDHRLDYCVVAVPTGQHVEVGMRLAQAGLPALVEKPLAPDLAAAARLVQAFLGRPSLFEYAAISTLQPRPAEPAPPAEARRARGGVPGRYSAAGPFPAASPTWVW